MNRPLINPIPLIRHVSGKRIMERRDPLFLEYRKRWVEQPLRLQVGDFPLFLDIEVTNTCNLLCKFCATTYLDKSIKRQLIPSGMVYKILDEGKQNRLYGVKFNDRGEPLLHPELFDFVRYAKECGLVDVYFNTNGLLLNEEMTCKAISSGLDRISFSVEGFTSEFYEKYRVNGKFDLLVRNIRRFWGIRKRLKSKIPLIRIQTVLLPEVMKNLKSYLDKYKRFWGAYADEIAAIEYKEEVPRVKTSAPCQSSWVCHQLWQRMVVLCDGQILPCNEDWQSLLSLGNINSISIRQGWNSKRLNKIRNIHQREKAHTIPACNSCYLRNSQIKMGCK